MIIVLFLNIIEVCNLCFFVDIFDVFFEFYICWCDVDGCLFIGIGRYCVIEVEIGYKVVFEKMLGM